MDSYYRVLKSLASSYLSCKPSFWSLVCMHLASPHSGTRTFGACYQKECLFPLCVSKKRQVVMHGRGSSTDMSELPHTVESARLAGYNNTCTSLLSHTAIVVLALSHQITLIVFSSLLKFASFCVNSISYYDEVRGWVSLIFSDCHAEGLLYQVKLSCWSDFP